MFLFLIAGAIGNLVDRVTLGYVRDFISFKFIDFPIFNVADIYITVSCVIILLICVFKLNNDDFNSIFTLKGAKHKTITTNTIILLYKFMFSQPFHIN